MDRKTALVMLCIASVGLTSCAIAQKKLVSTASFDHDCPPEKIKILKKAPDVFAYDVDVCGKKRKYRDFGNEKEFQFVDVTDGTPQPLRTQ